MSGRFGNSAVIPVADATQSAVADPGTAVADIIAERLRGLVPTPTESDAPERFRPAPPIPNATGAFAPPLNPETDRIIIAPPPQVETLLPQHLRETALTAAPTLSLWDKALDLKDTALRLGSHLALHTLEGTVASASLPIIAWAADAGLRLGLGMADHFSVPTVGTFAAVGMAIGAVRGFLLRHEA